MKQHNRGFLKAVFMSMALPAILLAGSVVLVGCDMVGKEDETHVAAPTASPAAGAVTSGTEITLSTTTAGAEIYYTIDGSTPSQSSAKYSSTVKPKILAATTLKAIAVKEGMTDSGVLTAAYTIATGGGETQAAMPKADPAAGDVVSNQEITLTSTTAGAEIYYTIDGSAPSKSSPKYSETNKPVIAETNTILKAIAVKEGMTDSGVLTAAYTIPIVTVPIIPDNLFTDLQAALDETASSAPSQISQALNQTYTVTIADTADLSGVTWYWVVDGVRQTETPAPKTLECAASAFTVNAYYYVTLFMEKGGVIASKEFTFRVTE